VRRGPIQTGAGRGPFAGGSSELIVLDWRIGAVYELPVDADWIVAANTKRVLSGQTKDP
jgi:hypothetical protein